MSEMGRREWMKLAAVPAGAAIVSAACTSETARATEKAAAEKSTNARGLSVATPDNAVVATTAGKIRGFTRNGVFIFKGIPYGDTTAGENRFMPPKPVKSWTSVRPTLAWGPVSPHGPRGGWVNQEEQFLYYWDDGFPGEDMLRVNVWTPAIDDGKKRPVLVWIHGGGYASGSSQELRPYDGERLAREHDVVLVSMNHRLNVFGFLDLSQIGGEKYAQSGNVSMLDLVQALQWVRDNIGAFGGDPGNVTIFGQSGGGGKVTTLHGDAGRERSVPQGRGAERVVHPGRQSRFAEAAGAGRDEGTRPRSVRRRQTAHGHDGRAAQRAARPRSRRRSRSGFRRRERCPPSISDGSPSSTAPSFRRIRLRRPRRRCQQAFHFSWATRSTSS